MQCQQLFRLYPKHLIINTREQRPRRFVHSLELPSFERFDLAMNLHGIISTHCPEVSFQRLHAGVPHDLLEMP